MLVGEEEEKPALSKNFFGCDGLGRRIVGDERYVCQAAFVILGGEGSFRDDLDDVGNDQCCLWVR